MTIRQMTAPEANTGSRRRRFLTAMVVLGLLTGCSNGGLWGLGGQNATDAAEIPRPDLAYLMLEMRLEQERQAREIDALKSENARMRETLLRGGTDADVAAPDGHDARRGRTVTSTISGKQDQASTELTPEEMAASPKNAGQDGPGHQKRETDIVSDIAALLAGNAGQPVTETMTTDTDMPANDSDTTVGTAPPASSLPGQPGDAVRPELAYAVHLASYDTAEAAKSGWRNIKDRYLADEPQMAARIAELNITGAGHYFRLKAGPIPSEKDARALCERLSAVGQYCVVSDFVGDDMP